MEENEFALLTEGLGYKQTRLVEIAAKSGKITFEDAKKLYGSRIAAKTALLSLETRGILRPDKNETWKIATVA